MAAASQDLLFRFLGVDDGAGAQFDRMAGKASTTGASLAKLGAGAAVAAGIVAIASIKMASTFQKSTELIHTQAGASQAQVDSYRKSILSLAGATATAPEALSEALFHIASTGVQGAQAINELRIAAEGAKVGGADLTDVTNALNSTFVSGISGVKGYSQAMGALNTIVGTGDMHMEDLAEALGTGMLTAVRGFGVTLPQVGAALATFGDNNIRGAQAATQLRMAVNALAKPVVSASGAFAQLGLKGDNALQHFAVDMQKGGLTKALADLHQRLVETGNTGAKTGAILVDAFGKKAGVGIAILEEEFGRFELKQAEIKEGAASFGSDWAATTKNLSFQFDRLRADVDVLAIKIGDDLIPVAMGAIHGTEDFGTALVDTAGFVDRNKVAVAALAGVLASAFIPAAIEAGTAFAASIYEDAGIRILYAKDAVVTLTASIRAMTVAELASVTVGTLGFAAIAAAGVEAWVQIRDRSKEATDYAHKYVSALKINTNSAASINTGTEALKKQIAVFKQAPNTFGVWNRVTAALLKQQGDLTGQSARAAKATNLLGAAFHMSSAQVLGLANKLGPGELQKPLQDVEKDFNNATTAARDSKNANMIAGTAFQDMGSQATTAAQGLTDLTNAFNALLGNFLNVKQAQLAFKNGMVELDSALKKSHDSLTLNTAAGRAARGDYLSQAQAIITTAEAVYKNTGSTQAARKATAAMRAELAKTPASGALVIQTMHKITSALHGMAGSMNSGGAAAGRSLGYGLIAGISEEQGAVGSAARALGSQAISEANRAMGNASPSKKMIAAGKNLDLGLAQGIADNAALVKKPIHDVAKLLFEGLSGGWRGEADKIKNQLTTPVQNALAHLNQMLDAQTAKDKARTKAAESTLKQALANRQSMIASAQQAITGSIDFSSLFGTDDNGNQTVGNLGQLVSTSLGPIQVEARDMALLRKKGLSQFYLSQISGLPPSQAVALMQQILSGQDGSIASLNATAAAINAGAKQTATTVVNSPAEKAAIARDKHAVKVAERSEKILERIEHHLERQAAKGLAAHLTVDSSGHTKWTAGSVKAFVKELNKEIQVGHVRISKLS